MIVDLVEAVLVVDHDVAVVVKVALEVVVLKDLDELAMLNGERLFSVVGVHLIKGSKELVESRNSYENSAQILKSAFMLSYAKWGEGPSTFYTIAKEVFMGLEKLEIRRVALQEMAERYGGPTNATVLQDR